MIAKFCKPVRVIGPLMFLPALAACNVPPEPVEVHDPYEPVNRVSHAVNKGADRVFFRPVSLAYGNVVPTPVRQGLSNAAENLDTPRSVLNDILQGEGEDAAHNTLRFLTNTTFGLLGVFDVAAEMGLEERETGFADTLVAWQFKEGAYVELPLFGPSTERDAVGTVVDIVMNPIGTVLGDNGESVATFTSFPSVLNSRFQFADTVDGILYESADSYSQLRLFYLESRRFELAGAGGGQNAFDPYEDLYDEVYEGLYDEIAE